MGLNKIKTEIKSASKPTLDRRVEDWFKLGWTVLNRVRPGWTGLDWLRLGWTGLDWLRLGWTELDSVGPG